MKKEQEHQSAAFHTLTAEAAMQRLGSRREGLTGEEAEQRREQYGRNLLQEAAGPSVLAKLLAQFKDVMILILLAAAIVSGLLGEWTDSIIILVVVILNAVLGVIQEHKAEQALSALKQMSTPHARVMRGGQALDIKAEELVPGDIVLLEAGNVVPADMRIIESASLKIEEAALTGESVPVEKGSDPLDEADLVIGDRINMAYMTSHVSYGRGLGVVTATGSATEVGSIAGYLSQEEDEVTPLQRKLNELGKTFTIIIVAVALVMFTVGLIEGRELFDMLLTSISLAVAAIPEGLPAIVTIILALGVQTMARRKAIIRKLPAVETLGSTDIICSDKTGTLTQNRMTVKEIYAENTLRPSGDGWIRTPAAERLMQVMVLCNDARLAEGGGQTAGAIGDPTETALIDYALLNGIDKREAERRLPRIAELPFDSDRKRMTTVHQLPAEENGEGGSRCRIMTKGAPDVLTARCTHILRDGRVEPMTEEHHRNIAAANKAMADKALRVLALAYRDAERVPDSLTIDALENDLVFAGLVGMIDPPREEVKEAVGVCKLAGIRPVMITGDHGDTAAAIAKELGIIDKEGAVLTGAELSRLDDAEFEAKVEQYSVYARVSPEHKVRIVKAWKKKGKIVAMTGDGVNDAPALKAADIGVGMGITGTDVAKGASDMVLADDNFSTIVLAVEEGRKVYSNIRKTIQYLLSANLGEVVTLFVATMLNWKILFPIHILWVNLVTDTLPALALGFERAEEDLMKQAPRQASASIFAGGIGVSLVYQGLLEAILTLLTYYWGHTHYSEDVAITMAFATLGLIQLTHAFNVRSAKQSLFQIGWFTNRKLNFAVIVSGLLIVLVIALPFLRDLFSVVALTGEQWLIVVAASLSMIPIVEIVKLFSRRRRDTTDQA
ncbi:ATPase [Paenibacillus dendritiformis]|uniref:calcium-translocating P-type ATPase, SERCA-type n=1 Tax=Paenibacillus dendritiformis TaxID=130049 RepID=UPI0018CD0EE8|nr:calcium-translocating P-type ATPase, SERCA-type [Paenibacillus dendritiformis]MBG9794593.1 ATPase [Paenibacillus dendritiformis]